MKNLLLVVLTKFALCQDPEGEVVPLQAFESNIRACYNEGDDSIEDNRASHFFCNIEDSSISR